MSAPVVRNFNIAGPSREVLCRNGVFGQVKQTQITQDRNLIVGAWSLSSYELRPKPSGTITTPFGTRPVGRILYEANGQMSAQLMRPETTAFASNDPLRATDEEAALAWRNYIGYWGTYTIDARAGIITHHIDGNQDSRRRNTALTRLWTRRLWICRITAGGPRS